MSVASRLQPAESLAPFSSSPYEPVLPPVERLEDIDLVDPDLYHRGDPHAAWQLLREKAPVFWHEKGAVGTEGKGFWVLTRYDDVGKVYQDSELFSSETGPFLDMLVDHTPRRILPSIDGREHQLRRAIVSSFFTRRELVRYEDMVRRIVTSLFDECEAKGSCDFSTDIAEKLPIKATCDVMGISEEEAEAMARMVIDIDSHAPDAMKSYNNAVLRFFGDLLEKRRQAGTTTSMVDAVANARIDGEPVSDEDATHLLYVLFHGGIDSSTHAMTGSLVSLFHHPGQMELLRKDPSLVESSLEELLRWTATSHANKRQATADTEIRGVKIRKGDYVSVWSPSANRDELAYEDPYRFDLRRIPGKPLSTFGLGGRHHCIGEYFARLEMKVLFEELFRRFPRVEQAGAAARSKAYTMLISPVTSLPIALNA